MYTQRVVWMRQGQTRWGAGWVGQYGKRKTHDPDELEHVGFANFDLKSNGLPLIDSDDLGLFVRAADVRQAASVLRIIQYHGFEFEDAG